MLKQKLPVAAAAVVAGCLPWLPAQPLPTGQATLTTVPRLVRISGEFRPSAGQPAAPVEGITLFVYGEEYGGTPLWEESQNVTVGAGGQYTVLMGASQSEGMPLDLFHSGRTLWLGIQFNRPGESEQPRIRLVSVPFALKASDADSLGGRPASDYLLADAAASSGSARAVAPAAASSTVSGTPRGTAKLGAHVTSGTTNYLGLFTNNGDLGNSVLYQNGGRIGVNTLAPADYLHVQFTNANGAFTGYAVQNLSSSALAYSGMLFYDQNGILGQFQGFNNTTHEYRVNNIASGGTINFMLASSSRLYVGSGGVGIGTTAPAVALDVAGDINFSGALRNKGNPVMQFNSLTGNTAAGPFALALNAGGTNNTATGFNALAFNTSGSQNTANGGYALFSNTTGSRNTAYGYGTLQSTTVGTDNTATGYAALAASAGAGYNTAGGSYSLYSTTIGQDNTADGYFALGNNTTGSQNTADGYQALHSNQVGLNNTAVGFNALYNSTGSNNIAVGYQAGYFVSNNNGDNIHIGNQGVSSDHDTIRIGTQGIHTSFFAAGIRGVTTSGNDAIPVMVDSNGQLGTVSSSRRFKEDIEDMGEASRNLLRLRPVTFRYKRPFADGSKPLQYGLIAEEVAAVYPDLVARSADGQIETVKYQVLDSMLLNEIQRQERELAVAKTRVADLERQVNELKAFMAELSVRASKWSGNPGTGKRGCVARRHCRCATVTIQALHHPQRHARGRR